jgi:hypothetical protein
MPGLSFTHTQTFLSSEYTIRPAGRSSAKCRQSIQTKCSDPSTLCLAWSERAVMRNVVQLAGHDAPVSGYYFFICVDQNRDIDANIAML